MREAGILEEYRQFAETVTCRKFIAMNFRLHRIAQPRVYLPTEGEFAWNVPIPARMRKPKES